MNLLSENYAIYLSCLIFFFSPPVVSFIPHICVNNECKLGSAGIYSRVATELGSKVKSYEKVLLVRIHARSKPCGSISARSSLFMKNLDETKKDVKNIGNVPSGPDPIALTQNDMKLLKKRIKSVIERNLGSGDSTHPLLKSSSKDFFERPEKAWRPMMTLLLSAALSDLRVREPAKIPNEDVNGNQLHSRNTYDDSMTVSEIVEIMHTSALIHDTVLEEYDALEKGNVAHRMYSSSIAGNKVSILAGDFLLSRASVLLASLRRTQVVEIMAGALEAIMKGQMQLHRPASLELTMAQYVRNIELRTAHLLAAGCECAAIVAGFPRGSEVASAAQEYGRNVGIAYQLVSDLQATQSNYEKLLRKMETCVLEGSGSGLCTFDPHELNEPLQRAGALIFVAERNPVLADQVRKGFEAVEDLLSARDAIESCRAVDEIFALAARHARVGVERLESALPESVWRDALVALAQYVIDPDQPRLKRSNYKDGLFVGEPSPAGLAGGKRERLQASVANARKGAALRLFSVREQVREGMRRFSESMQRIIPGN